MVLLHKHFDMDAVPLDVFAWMLSFQDARDLMSLRAADPGLFDRRVSELRLRDPLGRAFVFVANRVLRAAERAWLESYYAARVQLLETREVIDPTSHINRREVWLRNGKLHRDGDLPAAVWADGSLQWFQDGLANRAGDLPTAFWKDGTHEWYRNGKLHRDGDRPAVIWSSGQREWYRDGKLHRDGGLPAIIRADGTQVRYQHGVQVV